MKKILLFCFMFFCVCNIANASAQVDFIYLNGSNTNSEKAYQYFEKRVSKFHPVLKSKLEKDAFISKNMLKNGEYTIQDNPSLYFWGFKSQEELMTMRQKANMLRGVSPGVAFAFRNTFANMLHDAVWVRNENNMIGIIDELHEQIMQDKKQGKKVVLLGYSAGTFITFEYIMRRAPYIDIATLFSNQKVPQNVKTYMKKHPKKHTCPAAFLSTDMASVSPFSTIVPNKNSNEILKAYNEIDKYTDKYCMPENTVLGVINYASPIPLFYSDISNPTTDYGKVLTQMYKYIIEQDFFFLTVNFADDPLGFPNDVNYTNEEASKMLNTKFNKEQGFFYDYSEMLSLRTVVMAHTCYLNAKKRFAKAIIKGYTEGYKFHYSK